MPLSDAVVRELRAELDRLEQSKAELDARISGIRIVLNGSLNGHRAAATNGTAAPVMPIAKKNGVTLRSAILDILRETRVADVAEVTRRLNEHGFTVGGATSLRERTSHELRRLRTRGIVTRRRSKYRLAAGPALAEAAADAAHSG